MHKTFVAILFISLLVASCGSHPPATQPAGTWTLGSTTYTVTSCVADSTSALITASGQSSGGTCTLVLSFVNGYPGSSEGTNYAVISGHNTATLPFADLIMIDATVSGPHGGSYYSSGDGTGSVTAGLIHSKVNMIGTNIQMLNNSNASDSSTLSFNIVQTN